VVSELVIFFFFFLQVCKSLEKGDGPSVIALLRLSISFCLFICHSLLVLLCTSPHTSFVVNLDELEK
jgi:hypothetical protein